MCLTRAQLTWLLRGSVHLSKQGSRRQLTAGSPACPEAAATGAFEALRILGFITLDISDFETSMFWLHW